MADFNLNASEFVPSWIKKTPPHVAAAEATQPLTSPPWAAASEPSAHRPPPGGPIPWKSPIPAAQGSHPPRDASEPQAQPPRITSNLSPDASEYRPPSLPSRTSNAPAVSLWPQNVAGSPSVESVLTRKSLNEIIEISSHSELKADAIVFVPGAPVKPAAPQPQPSPPLAAIIPVHSHADGPMILNDKWSLYFVDRSASGTESFDPCLVLSVETVEEFWRLWNNIPTPSQLVPGSTVFLFRDGVEPRWEDPSNCDGGCWQMRLPLRAAETADVAWERLCCQTIAEAWTGPHRDTVNGVIVKVRDKYFTLQVWVTERVDDFPHELMDAFEAVIAAFSVDYIKHDTARECSVPKEQTPKKKKKKQLH